MAMLTQRLGKNVLHPFGQVHGANMKQPAQSCISSNPAINQSITIGGDASNSLDTVFNVLWIVIRTDGATLKGFTEMFNC
jgi:hypothetical protein